MKIRLNDTGKECLHLIPANYSKLEIFTNKDMIGTFTFIYRDVVPVKDKSVTYDLIYHRVEIVLKDCSGDIDTKLHPIQNNKYWSIVNKCEER